MKRLLVALGSLSVSCTFLFSPDTAGNGSDAATTNDGAVDSGGVPLEDAVTNDAAIARYTCDQGTEALYHFDGTLVDECMTHPLDGPFLFGNGHITGSAYGEVAATMNAYPTTDPTSLDFWYRSRAGGEGVLVAVQGAVGAQSSNVAEIRQTATALELSVYAIGCDTNFTRLQVLMAPPTQFVHVSATFQSAGLLRLSVLGAQPSQTSGIISCTSPTEATFLHVGGLPGDSPHAYIEELRVSSVVREPHQFP